MDNEDDEWVEVLKRSGLEGKHFEAKGVSRGEFEALKRFGVYKQLVDGTLMRIEGDKEYRIYCEDASPAVARAAARTPHTSAHPCSPIDITRALLAWEVSGKQWTCYHLSQRDVTIDTQQ